MKTNIITTIFVASTLLFINISCSSTNSIEQREDQKERGDSTKDIGITITDSNDKIIEMHGKVENSGRFREFIQNINGGQNDHILIVRYTTEGDPIFFEFKYDKGTINYVYDSSNDEYGNGLIATTSCTNFIKEDFNNETIYKIRGCSGENTEIENYFELLLGNE